MTCKSCWAIVFSLFTLGWAFIIFGVLALRDLLEGWPL